MTGSAFPKAMSNSPYALSGAVTTMQGTIPQFLSGVNEPPKATNLL